MHIVLDAGPLGMLSHPAPASTAPGEWARAQIAAGHRFVVAEIADYEVRRELLRAHGAGPGIDRLDRLATWGYQAITTRTMRIAAELWADARRAGRPTAPDHALDGDVVLAAQALELAGQTGRDVVIATTNVRHLERYVDARLWTDL